MLKVSCLTKICLFADLGDSLTSDERRLALNFDRQLPGTQTTSDFSLKKRKKLQRQFAIQQIFGKREMRVCCLFFYLIFEFNQLQLRGQRERERLMMMMTMTEQKVVFRFFWSCSENTIHLVSGLLVSYRWFMRMQMFQCRGWTLDKGSEGKVEKKGKKPATDDANSGKLSFSCRPNSMTIHLSSSASVNYTSSSLA